MQTKTCSLTANAKVVALRRMALALVSALPLGWAAPALANMDTTGWTCTGICGTSGADGVVTASPAGGNYGYVSTNLSTKFATGATQSGNISGGVIDPDLVPASILAALKEKEPTMISQNGSKIMSPPFTAHAGATIGFYFNYISSDGYPYSDYAWARLIDSSGHETMLYAARTTNTGNTVPGTNMPVPVATLTPPYAPMISDGYWSSPSPGKGPAWSPLGTSSSGACYLAPGCGYTGWVKMSYTIPAGGAGTYRLEFGVINMKDMGYQSGMAFDGIAINPPNPPVCTAVPNVAAATTPVKITCVVDAGTTNEVGGVACATVGTTATCNADGQTFGSNPTATSTDAWDNTSTGNVDLTIIGPPAAPVCTANPNPAAPTATVTINCAVDARTVTTIPNATCPTTRTTAKTDITCAGTASALGNDPKATSTNDVGLSSTGTALLTVRGAPAAPVCTATPNPAAPAATVTIICQVDAHTVTAIPGATCPTTRTTAATSITCTGLASALHSDPTATSTNDVNLSSNGLVPLTVRGGPAAPECTATPNPADPSASVTITCQVDGHTVTTIPGATCPTTRTTAATSITCTGTASVLGNNPTATSTDDVANTSTGQVPLTVKAPPLAQPIPTLGEWGLIALALMLLGMSGATLRKGARR